MKSKRGRPGMGHKKVGLSISEATLKDAQEEARSTCRTLSGFFEYAAKVEIDRAKQAKSQG